MGNNYNNLKEYLRQSYGVELVYMGESLKSTTLLWMRQGIPYHVSDAIRDCKQLLNIISTYSKNKSAKVYLHAMRALQSLLLRLVGRDNNPPKKEELHALVDVIKEIENYHSMSEEEKMRNEIVGEEIKILISLFYRDRVKC